MFAHRTLLLRLTLLCSLTSVRAYAQDVPVLAQHFVGRFAERFGKQVVGIARVAKEAYADPTAEEGDWSCVDLTPLKVLVRAVSLETIKLDKLLREMPLVKQSRLSVTPLSEVQAKRLLELAETRL